MGDGRADLARRGGPLPRPFRRQTTVGRQRRSSSLRPSWAAPQLRTPYPGNIRSRWASGPEAALGEPHRGDVCRTPEETMRQGATITVGYDGSPTAVRER